MQPQDHEQIEAVVAVISSTLALLHHTTPAHAVPSWL